MLPEELNEEISLIFNSNINSFKRDQEKIAFRLDKEDYSEEFIASKMAELKENYEFLYSTTVDKDEILCLIISDSDDPRFYLTDVLVKLDVDNYKDTINSSEQIADAINKRYMYDPLDIAILTVYIVKDYDIEKIYQKLNINEELDNFKIRINNLKKDIEKDVLEDIK